MYPTAEVRWFFRGPVPPDVAAWFERGTESIRHEPPREDRYLRLCDTDDLNIKLREGRLEIKQRVGETETVQFHPQVSGVVEQWNKHGFVPAEEDDDTAAFAHAGRGWVAVDKDRSVRTFRVAEDSTVVVPTTTETPQRGCGMELTTVRALGRLWWTLALEAFGRPSSLHSSLLLTAQHVFASGEPPSLPNHRSYGYAAWLSRLA